MKKEPRFPTRTLYDLILQLQTPQCEFTEDFSSIRQIVQKVRVRCARYPEDAQFLNNRDNDSGNLPLHLLVHILDHTGLGSALRCSRNDYTLAQGYGLGCDLLWMVLNVFPDAIVVQNCDGLTPMHLGSLLDVKEWNILYQAWCEFGCSADDIARFQPDLPLELADLISQYSLGPKLIIQCNNGGDETIAQFMLRLQSRTDPKRWSEYLFADADVLLRVEKIVIADKRFLAEGHGQT